MEELATIYEFLKKDLKPLFWNRFSKDNIFNCHITSAYSKCYEFNVLVNKENDISNSFFYSPALRGICEDVIVLKFFKKQTKLNSNKIIEHFMMIQLIDISDRQKEFFLKNNPQQIVFEYPNAGKVREENTNAIKEEWLKIGLNREKVFPSTSQMATDSGLVELYNYLYSATSDMVHFSPHVLMRAGWSKKDDEFLHEFSTKNFSKYYKLFNQFYGAYLFVLFNESFKKELKIPKAIVELVKQIKVIISDEYRWPELITFEEMNHPDAHKIKTINMIRKIKARIRGKN